MDLAVAAVLLEEVAAVVLPALLLQAVAVEDQHDHEAPEDRFVRQEEGEEEEEDPPPPGPLSLSSMYPTTAFRPYWSKAPRNC